MSKAEEYRKHAAECRRQSETALPNSEEQKLWLKTAKEWVRMAEAAEHNPDAF